MVLWSNGLVVLVVLEVLDQVVSLDWTVLNSFIIVRCMTMNGGHVLPCSTCISWSARSRLNSLLLDSLLSYGVREYKSERLAT